jgi:hypothetical protein
MRNDAGGGLPGSHLSGSGRWSGSRRSSEPRATARRAARQGIIKLEDHWAAAFCRQPFGLALVVEDATADVSV